MVKLGVAIIGLGGISSVHIEGYLTFENECKIKVICDNNKEKAEKVLLDLALDNVQVISDWKQLLSDPKVDLVSICLPPGLHAEIAIALLGAGKNVLIEKPMALSLRDCDQIIKTAKENNVIVSVVAQNRYKVPTMKVKQLISEGIAGQIHTSVVNSLWWRGENYYDIWWRGTWESEGGGCMMNHAVHHIDLLQWMNGMPKKVTAVITNLAHSNSECEDHAIAILQYPNMIAQVTASLLAHDEEQEMVFQTKKARLSIPWKPAASKALENGFPEKDVQFLKKIQARYDAIEEIKYEGHTGQIQNVIKAINGEENLMVDGHEGRNSIELIMAVYKSATTGKTVELPLGIDDTFYDTDSFVQTMPHFNEKTISTAGFKENVITLGRDICK
ncbi:MAG: Gfo/Idh/MocA family oxidoreductase [Spirochaetaceae bacterium]|jgi:UDP-N-acetyl-2-amino-2-deoxyglucuronate dehydrogenase|nr:Gfo/Idh/MocA family oxidoreductase [Spirochaetaceae bacterium]